MLIVGTEGTLAGGENGKRQLDLFRDWADSVAAKLRRRREDLAAVATKAVPAACVALGTWWQNADDPFLRTALAVAAFACLLLTALTWGTRAFESNFQRQDVPIYVYSTSLVSAGLLLTVAFGIFLYSDLHHATLQNEEAAKARAEQEAELAVAKKEAERLAEERAARAAEEECEKARTEAIDKAKKAQRSARKALDECKSNYDKNLFALGNANEHCKSAQGQLDSIKAQLGFANAKTCTTASIGKGQ